LRRTLFNLLDNAIKHTPEGGKVEVRSDCDGAEATLTVSDTGSGIPQEHIPRIFERFYRVDPARAREDGGIGLGLAICHAIGESRGGTIRLESRTGQGTKVIVALPLLQAGATRPVAVA